jgi:hypothetical protein
MAIDDSWTTSVGLPTDGWGTGGIATPDSANFPVPPIPPPQSDIPAGQGATWQTNAASLASTLKDAAKSLTDANKAAGGDAATTGKQTATAPAGTAQSTYSPGNASALSNLVSMLLQRQNQYFPGAPNTQPVNQGRSIGLLGM